METMRTKVFSSHWRKTSAANEEVKREFIYILEKPKRTKLLELIHLSEKLLDDTISGREEEVAKTRRFDYYL